MENPSAKDMAVAEKYVTTALLGCSPSEICSCPRKSSNQKISQRRARTDVDIHSEQKLQCLAL